MRAEVHASYIDMVQAVTTITKIVNCRENKDLELRIRELALQRAFEILGEAAIRIRRYDLDEFELIPDGNAIVGLRNHLAHGYDTVDQVRLLSIAVHQVPQLENWLSEKLAVSNDDESPGT